MKTILKKLHEIQKELGSLKKEGHNDFQNYDYLKESDIKAAVQPLLKKHGVLFQLSMATPTDVQEFTTAKGGHQFLVKLHLLYKFYDIESGECLEGSFEGHGADSGDKGIYKAYTGAIKYILTSLFLIPTGDDPENDKKTAPVPRVTSQRKTAPIAPQSATKENNYGVPKQSGLGEMPPPPPDSYYGGSK